MKGGDRIETAPINFLQTKGSENQFNSTVDKEAFLHKLESFLTDQGDVSLKDTTLSEQVVAVIEQSISEDEELDLEEELQALFSPQTFLRLTDEKFTHVSEEQTAIVKLESEAMEQSTTTFQQLETNQAKEFEAIVEKSIQKVMQEPVEKQVPTSQEGLQPTQVENSVQSLPLEKEIPSKNVESTLKNVTQEINSSSTKEAPLETQLPVEHDKQLKNQLFVKNEEITQGAYSSEISSEPTEKLTVFEPESENNSLSIKEIPSDFKREDNQAFFVKNENKVVDQPVITKESQQAEKIKEVAKQEWNIESVDNMLKPIEQFSMVQTNSVAPNLEPEPIFVSKEQWTSQVEQILVKEVQTADGNKVTTTHIQLTPEHLGKMKLDLRIENRELFVQIQVEHLETKEWMETQLSALYNNLTTQEIAVATIQIEIEPTLDNPFSFDQGQETAQEEQSFKQKQWKNQGYSKDQIVEQEVSPNVLNTARGISLWA